MTKDRGVYTNLQRAKLSPGKDSSDTCCIRLFCCLFLPFPAACILIHKANNIKRATEVYTLTSGWQKFCPWEVHTIAGSRNTRPTPSFLKSPRACNPPSLPGPFPWTLTRATNYKCPPGTFPSFQPTFTCPWPLPLPLPLPPSPHPPYLCGFPCISHDTLGNSVHLCTIFSSATNLPLLLASPPPPPAPAAPAPSNSNTSRLRCVRCPPL